MLVPLIVAAALASPPLPTVAEVTRHLDDLYRADTSHARITMDIKTKHFSRTLEIESWSSGKDLSVAVIRKPAREAGTASLRTKDGMWNYAPRADRLMRIPTALLSESWMGSHLTNDDLMRESSWEDDYETTMQWGTHDSARVLEVVMIPRKNAAVVYSKVVQTLAAEGWYPLEVDYYDGKDVVRTIEFLELTDYQGRKMPRVMRVVPHDKPDERTVVRYVSFEWNQPVPPGLFTARGLRKAAQR